MEQRIEELEVENKLLRQVIETLEQQKKTLYTEQEVNDLIDMYTVEEDYYGYEN